MFLSRLTLNPLSADARRDLADAYQMHRTLSRVYAKSDADPVPRFLWRLERGAATASAPVVLVQTATPGRWEGLTALPGYLVLDQCDTDKPVALDTLVVDGRRCRFRLRANPAVKRQGRRSGLHDEAAQLAWLQRQADRSGFTLLGADVSQRERLQVRQPRDGRHITVDAVQYDGMLTVTDATLLRPALLAGIGPAKSLGMGLLSLPLSRHHGDVLS